MSRSSPSRPGTGRNILSHLALALAIAACSESPVATAPDVAVSGPSAEIFTASTACPLAATADHVVDDVWSLHDAHTYGQPGSVVAIKGMIEIPADIDVAVDGMTFTCAEPGSGIRAAPGAGVDWLFVVTAADVRIERLVLDASETNGGALRAYYDGEELNAANPSFVANDVTCGPEECVFFIGTPGAFASDNRIDAGRGFSGLHLLGVVDGEVTRNRIWTDDPVEDGLRVSEASRNISIVDNEVMGTWYLFGISVFAEAEGVRIEGNHIGGSGDPSIQTLAGVGVSRSRDVTVRDNVIHCDPVACRRSASVGGGQTISFVDNRLQCGWASCVVGVAVDGLRVIENDVSSTGSNAGLFIREAADAQVVGNAIVTTAPSGFETSAAIMILEARDASQVRENSVSGPWTNGILLGGTALGSVTGNSVEGAQLYGMRISGDRNEIRDNRVSGAGQGGALLIDACHNRVVENQLHANGEGISVVLDPSTGANYVDQSRGMVVDTGDRDCDGDGLVDPNVIVEG